MLSFVKNYTFNKVKVAKAFFSGQACNCGQQLKFCGIFCLEKVQWSFTFPSNEEPTFNIKSRKLHWTKSNITLSLAVATDM